MSPRYIVVGVDFNEPSCAAARWTARYLVGDGDLVLAHALYLPEPPSFLRGYFPPTDQLIEDARRGAELRLHELSLSLAAPRVRSEIRVGQPDEVLRTVSTELDAELLVVGPHGGRPGIWRLLGGTAERVARHAPTSVLLARGLPSGPPQRVLLALSESELVAPMVAWAAYLVERFHATVVAMHVTNPLAAGALGIAAAEPERRKAQEGLRRNAEAWLGKQVAPIPTKAVALNVAFGDVALELLSAVQRFDADLLVIGRHGAARPGAPFLGSTAELTLRSGSGPVLLVARAPAANP